MIINRHNYEEFFLMYVDNELTPAQKAVVEFFVEQNQDLADELKMFQQVTLLPDEQVKFESKKDLYKTEQGISLANCEEYFLLHVDNELNAVEKEEVEKFVLQHPQSQEAFTLLHKTKLEPETIIFEQKAVLYHKEERRVIPMRWMRMAVAAAVTGIVGVLHLTVPGKQLRVPIDGETAGVPKSAARPTQSTPAVLPNVPRQQVATINEPTKLAANPTAGLQVKVKAADKKQKSVDAIVTRNVAIVNADPRPKQKTNNLPVPTANNDVAINSNIEEQQDAGLAQGIFNRTANTNKIAEVKTEALTAAAKIKEDDNIMKQAVYREVDTRNEEEENSFLLGSIQINKNKVRGLLKKATSFFDKKGDKNDKEKSVQSASFEIKGK